MDELLKIQQEYIDAKREEEEAIAKTKAIKERIIEMSKGEPFTGRLISFSKINKKGNVDYVSLTQFLEVSNKVIESYRKPSYTVNMIKINPEPQGE